MTKAVWGAAAITALVCAVATTPVAAQKTISPEPIKPVAGVSGSVTFRAYCAQCHGISGQGNGPAAGALKVAPADLTQIAKRHHGQFPANAVRNTIAGEQVVAAHGTREMPMWGPVLRSVDGHAVTELRLVNLVKYLEQIQEK